eukprot:1161078-Pelagomonas_calceolata.AAC.4
MMQARTADHDLWRAHLGVHPASTGNEPTWPGMGRRCRTQASTANHDLWGMSLGEPPRKSIPAGTSLKLTWLGVGGQCTLLPYQHATKQKLIGGWCMMEGACAASNKHHFQPSRHKHLTALSARLSQANHGHCGRSKLIDLTRRIEVLFLPSHSNQPSKIDTSTAFCSSLTCT